MNADAWNTFDEHLRNAKQLASNRLLRANFLGNVVGVGIGKKMIAGEPTQTDCVRIYVQSKLEIEDVTPACRLPASFLDIPTDVIEVKNLGDTIPAATMVEPSTTIGPGSPIRLESRASNVDSGAIGTLGAVVIDGNGKRYILGCNHILTVNGRVNTDRPAQVVFADAANPPYQIATPGIFVRLNPKLPNLVDCALAPIDKRANVKSKFPDGIGDVSSAALTEPYIGQKVSKVGAVTKTTYGMIVDVDADLFVDYSFGTFLFTNQIVIDGEVEENPRKAPNKDKIFATEGDSGAIVLDKGNHAVAMVFAESGRFAVACPFSEVLDQLGVVLEGKPPREQKPKRINPKIKPAFVIENTHVAKDMVEASRSFKRSKQILRD